MRSTASGEAFRSILDKGVPRHCRGKEALSAFIPWEVVAQTFHSCPPFRCTHDSLHDSPASALSRPSYLQLCPQCTSPTEGHPSIDSNTSCLLPPSWFPRIPLIAGSRNTTASRASMTGQSHSLSSCPSKHFDVAKQARRKHC